MSNRGATGAAIPSEAIGCGSLKLRSVTRNNSSLRAWSIPLLLASLTIVFFWKILLTDQYTWLESPDLAHQVLPWLQFQAGEWQAGRFPTWSPYEWGGQPVPGQTQPGAMYPINWLLFLIPLKRGWLRFTALHWYFALLHFLAVWFAYRLCRDRKASRLGSVAGAIAFGFGGYVGTTDWPQMLNGAIWAPLVFLYLLRLKDGRRAAMANGALSGLFLGCAWLSGHHQVPIFLSLAAGVTWLWLLARDRRLLPAAAAFGVVMVMVGSMQLWPAYEYGKLAKRWVGLDDPVGWKQVVPYFIHQQYGFLPQSLFGIVLPGFHVNSSAFVGVTGVVLAALGARRGRSWAILAGAGLLYSLAQFTPLEGIFYALLPMVEKARSPSMATILVATGLAPLIALGLDRVAELRHRRLTRGLGIAGTGLLALLGAVWIVRGAWTLDARLVVTAMVALGLAAALPWRHPARPAVLAALLFWELTLVGPFYWTNRFDKQATRWVPPLSAHGDIAAYLAAQPGPPRVWTDDKAIPYNLGDWAGIDVYSGYLASITENLTELQLVASARTRELMGVTHFVGYAPPEPDWTLVFRGASGANVYAAPRALPRLWTAHVAFPARTAEERRRLHENVSFDYRRAVIVERDSKLAVCDGEDRVALLRRDPTRVIAAVATGCRAMLVFNDVSFPGWKATIDGRAAAVETVNTAQRGVVVETGWHTVELTYRPAWLQWSPWLSLMGLVVAVGLRAQSKRRS